MRGFTTNGIIDEARIPATRDKWAPQKQCPACGFKQPCGARTCKNPDSCAHVFYKNKQKPKLVVTPALVAESIPAPSPTTDLRAECMSIMTTAFNQFFDKLDGLKAPLTAPATVALPVETATDSQRDEALNVIMRSIVELNETIRNDNEILRDKIDDLNSTVIAIRGTINILRDIHKDQIPKHEPIVTNHNGILAPKRKSIVVIGLIANQINEVREKVGDRANLNFIDASKNREIPYADYVITSRHVGHEWDERARQKVGDKRYKHLDTTSADAVVKTVMDFASRQ